MHWIQVIAGSSSGPKETPSGQFTLAVAFLVRHSAFAFHLAFARSSGLFALETPRLIDVIGMAHAAHVYCGL
jgi:hypothetical protein